MDKPTCSACFDTATNQLSYFQDPAFSQSATSCQAFSRDVVEVANILCAMRTDKTTKHFLQQPTVSIATVTTQLNGELHQQNTPPADNELNVKVSACSSGEYLTISHGKNYQTDYVKAEKRKASRRAWAQSEKGKAYRKAYARSEKAKAYHKAYAQCEKRKASKRAYEQSEKRKALKRAYEQSEKRQAYKQSEKRRACQKAYAQSEKGKAQQRAYAQSKKGRAYQRAYREVYKTTGDREQAKVAGKRASALARDEIV
ncbi:hypothetical protein [Endozoicomonas sp. SCSIO W0465]|uniref:hypothetical protein n=1 Tax=Endozoicomonas sp. SCSIO W0465 TaxID=2918516 RepID=UPI002075BB9B|nr:hypothetical protein [Endozoicomonas sp. SCSIO W0465]USE34509.1 hypothetical protein MJO57_20505 [Endozoicomonas sp. SCSIO W0465]